LRKELLLPKVVGPFDSIEVPIRRTLRCFIWLYVSGSLPPWTKVGWSPAGRNCWGLIVRSFANFHHRLDSSFLSLFTSHSNAFAYALFVWRIHFCLGIN
jgi:hypothetical protein